MPNQETGVIAWMARNPVAANLLLIVVMVAGLQALFGVTKEVFPTFPAEVITVTVPYPGSSPEEVEEQARWTYRKDYMGYGCKEAVIASFCDPRCPLKCNPAKIP